MTKSLEITFENITISFKCLVSYFIVKNKDIFNSNEKNGIYSLYCGDSKPIYVDQTSRALETRILEHINSTEVSQFDKHHTLRNRHFNNKECTIIHIVNNRGTTMN